MIVPSVLLVAGAEAAARVRYNNNQIHHQATAQKYGETHLGAIDLHKFFKSWNATMGPPPRGWYQAEFFMDNKLDNNAVIKKSGEDGQTKQSFDFDEFPPEHYCRFRNDDRGENDECCNEEDQDCYTKAGCYCDTACFTIYGDCCTDHFVTCYDDLKLCLKKVKSDDSGSKNLPGLAGNHRNATKKAPTEMLHDVSANAAHVEPNACCGQEEYNDEESCCLTDNGRRRLVKGTEQCESSEEDEDDVDARIQESTGGLFEDEKEYDYSEEEEF